MENRKRLTAQALLLTVKANAKRGVKFLIAGIGGFLFVELLLYIGIRLFSTSALPEIDVVSAFLSVMFGFSVNEHWSTAGDGYHPKGALKWVERLLLFEGVYAFGNVVSIAVQLFLFYYFGILPYIGTFIGTLVAFPLNYLISMKIVWKIDIMVRQA